MNPTIAAFPLQRRTQPQPCVTTVILRSQQRQCHAARSAKAKVLSPLIRRAINQQRDRPRPHTLSGDCHLLLGKQRSCIGNMDLFAQLDLGA
ncbi:Uncharacterised protein [Serratia fonticola]|uniref:Uncharacterized protein n=1 Tax=Serratia fonticola TaxID=47917 RepID=A0A448SZK6_SERFO|nr:Uncharacterised protein [Serratia fonticola]